MASVNKTNIVPQAVTFSEGNPTASSDPVQARVACARSTDSGESTLDAITMTQNTQGQSDLDPKDIEMSTQHLKVDETKSRRASVSSIASDASGTLKKRRREPDYTDAKDEYVHYRERKSILDVDACAEALINGVVALREKQKFAKSVVEYVASHMLNFKDIVLKIALENVSLRQQLKKQDKETTRPSYRDKLLDTKASRAPPIRVPTGTKVQPVRRHAVTIKSLEQETPEKIKAKLRQSIDPMKDKIHIKAVRKLKSGSVVVETDSEQDLNKIIKCQKLKENRLEVTKQYKKKPRMIIYDVPVDMESEQLVSAIKGQNDGIIDNEDDLRPCFKTGKKDTDTVHWVVEAAPNIRNILHAKKRLYIGWQRCRVSDFQIVSRCFKCQGLGHIAKFCKIETSTCGKCSQDGHVYTDCKSKNKIAKCAPCRRAGKPADHLMDNKCPLYKIALERVIANTDYG